MAKVPFPCCCDPGGCGDYGGTWYIKFCNYGDAGSSCSALEQLEGTELSFSGPPDSSETIILPDVDLGANYFCVASAQVRYWTVTIVVNENVGGNDREIQIFLAGSTTSGPTFGAEYDNTLDKLEGTCSGVFDVASRVGSTSTQWIEAIVSKSSGITCP